MYPELILGYEEDGAPSSAVCSACGQQMPDPPLDALSSSERYAWYTLQFQNHLCQRHPNVGHSVVNDG
jgi:hypothetical protein